MNNIKSQVEQDNAYFNHFVKRVIFWGALVGFLIGLGFSAGKSTDGQTQIQKEQSRTRVENSHAGQP